MKTEIEEANDRIDYLEDQNETLRRAVTALQDIADRRAERISNLKEEVSDLEDEIEDLKECLEEQEATILRLQKQIDDNKGASDALPTNS